MEMRFWGCATRGFSFSEIVERSLRHLNKNSPGTQGSQKTDEEKNNIAFIQNSEFLIFSERLMAIDRKNTKISAGYDYYE